MYGRKKKTLFMYIIKLKSWFLPFDSLNKSDWNFDQTLRRYSFYFLCTEKKEKF